MPVPTPASILALTLLSGPQQLMTDPVIPPALSGWSLQSLAVPKGLPEEFTVTVTLGDRVESIRFYRHSLRSESFRVLVDHGDGQLVETEVEEPRTYRGLVIGEPGSVAAGSLLHDGLSAMVYLVDGTTWGIEPVSRLSDNAQNDPRYAVYSGSQIVPTGHGCGFDPILHAPPVRFEKQDEGDGAGQGDGGALDGGIAEDPVRIAEIGFETDFEFYQKNGSSVTNTINDIELVMNNADVIYERDVQLIYEFTAIIVRSSSSDPYTATTIDGRLCEFRNTWNTTPESTIKRDVAHMFSGYNYSGSTIGIAWLGVVCNLSGADCSGIGNLAYSVVESRYLTSTPLNLRVSLSCHELGHNWNATHCDSEGPANCNIMCSSNGGCGGVSGSNLKFNTLSINQITAFKNSSTCLPLLPSAATPPFIDNFPSLSVNTGRWIWNFGGISTSLGVNEPSPPYSLNLDSTGAQDYQNDEVRSNRILLGGSTSAKASYWTQHRGVEAGKRLYVDYYTSAKKWANLNTIESNGVDQNNYVYWEHALPSNARHDNFRIRFRTEGSDGTDDWYIDDVTVEIPPPPPPCPADLNNNGVVDGADLGVLLAAWGACTGCAADLNGNGVVDGADLGVLLAAWGACP